MYPLLYPLPFSDIDNSTTCVKSVTCQVTLSVRMRYITYQNSHCVAPSVTLHNKN